MDPVWPELPFPLARQYFYTIQFLPVKYRDWERETYHNLQATVPGKSSNARVLIVY